MEAWYVQNKMVKKSHLNRDSNETQKHGDLCPLHTTQNRVRGNVQIQGINTVFIGYFTENPFVSKSVSRVSQI